MTIQNPGALVWLLPLAGAIIFLYLLRMKRRDMKVPASFLWPARTEEVRANALIQKLRFSWLMVLQLLALALLTMGLAHPQTKQAGLAGEVTVLVIDASASMQATDVAPSRFQEAKRLAKSTIQSMHLGDRVALIEAGPTPRVISALSSDPAKVLTALEKLEPWEAEADTGEALRLAAAIVGGLDGARIVLLSDGCFPPVRNFSRGKAAVVYHPIGTGNSNLRIGALGISETPQGRQVFCNVQNMGTASMKAVVNLYADGKAIDSVPVTIRPNGSWAKTEALPGSARVVEAKLDAKDLLAADNYAVTIADKGAALHVLLVGKGDLFLERALTLDPRVTLDRTAELPADSGQGYDIVIFDGVPEQPTRASGVLTLGTAGPTSPVKSKGRMNSPAAASAEDSALMKSVDLKPVFIESAELVEPTGEGKVVASASQGPLVVESEKPGLRQVYVAFRPMKSDFPLQVGFPIFIANVLDFLGGGNANGPLLVRTGSPFSVATTQPAELRDPEGHTTKLTPLNGAVAIRGLASVGDYELKVGGNVRHIYGRLDSERESKVAPEPEVAIGGGEVKATQSPVRFADFWRPLVLLVLLVLTGEWWLYARKS